MGENIISSVVGILTAVVGLAIVAVILRKNSETVNVLQSSGSFFSAIIGKAVSPVSN